MLCDKFGKAFLELEALYSAKATTDCCYWYECQGDKVCVEGEALQLSHVLMMHTQPKVSSPERFWLKVHHSSVSRLQGRLHIMTSLCCISNAGRT